jgi:hypothetical protein
MAHVEAGAITASSHAAGVQRWLFVSSPGAASACARQRSSVPTLTPHLTRDDVDRRALRREQSRDNAILECLSVSSHVLSPAPPHSAALNARQLV